MVDLALVPTGKQIDSVLQKTIDLSASLLSLLTPPGDSILNRTSFYKFFSKVVPLNGSPHLLVLPGGLVHAAGVILVVVVQRKKGVSDPLLMFVATFYVEMSLLCRCLLLGSAPLLFLLQPTHTCMLSLCRLSIMLIKVESSLCLFKTRFSAYCSSFSR